MRRIIGSFVFLGLIGAIGCGGSSSSSAPTGGPSSPNIPIGDSEQQKEMKLNLKLLMVGMDIYGDEQGRFPPDNDELHKKVSDDGKLRQLITEGKIVVNWGVASRTATWYAYEKEAPAKGGLIAVRGGQRGYDVVEKSAGEIKKIIGK